MCGAEHRRFGEIYLAMSRETDPQRLQELAVEYHDELRRLSAQVGVLDVPFFPIYNSEMIESWDMYPEGKGSLGGLQSLYNVKLR